jgi:FeS assembly SUF system protein
MIQVASPADRYSDNRASPPTSLNAADPLHGQIISALKTVYDPEIPVNIVDLGLIYSIDSDVEHNVRIRMTLTAPACPVAGSLPGIVAQAVRAVPDVGEVGVELVWDPPWSKERMSDEARIALGIFE